VTPAHTLPPTTRPDGQAAPGPDRAARPPAARRSRPVLTEGGREALADARAAADLVRDHRDRARAHAGERARAVRRANENGASYRVIAESLDVSLGMVQQFMAAASRLIRK